MNKTTSILTILFILASAASGYSLNQKQSNSFSIKAAHSSHYEGVSKPAHSASYQPADEIVEHNTSVLFDLDGTQGDVVSMDPASGTFTILKKGNYSISFALNVFGNGIPAFGIQLNHGEILQGTYNPAHPSKQIAHCMHVKVLVDPSLDVGDTINIINLSANTYQLSNERSGNNNGYLLFKKI
ncbi:MAG: hypothetical protein WCF65_00625 [Parachlamydiaceae bacterium]